MGLAADDRDHTFDDQLPPWASNEDDRGARRCGGDLRGWCKSLTSVIRDRHLRKWKHTSCAGTYRPRRSPAWDGASYSWPLGSGIS